MASRLKLQLALGLLEIICVLGICTAAFTPADNYLINCGSSVDTTISQRIFAADNSTSITLTSPQSIAANISQNAVSSFDNSVIYQTARIFMAPSSYSFKIKNSGRHFVRLYFFPFRYQTYDLSTANFTVSMQDTVLLNGFAPPSDSSPVFREYLLNITRDSLILTFLPLGRMAFVNAIEVVSAPDSLIFDSAPTLNPVGQFLGLSMQPLQTVYRINVGGPKVTPDNDTLWRTWTMDQSFLLNPNVTQNFATSGNLNYKRGEATREDAPDSVYRTARELFVTKNSSGVSSNMTWQFDVDGNSSYLIRFHFCDIVSKAAYTLYFDVYVDSWTVAKDLDLSTKVLGTLAVPYYMDAILSSSDPSGKLRVSIGPLRYGKGAPDGILNGLEIMKMHVSTGSVVVVEPASAAKQHLAVILGSVLGGIAAVIIVTVLFITLRKKKKAVPPLKRQPLGSWALFSSNGLGFVGMSGPTSLTSRMSSDQSYRIPLAILQEATNYFDEQLVIGAGGFGKVYKGALQDGTKFEVKRGNRRSYQGMREFRNEIELLSGLRHRHLVSLIGYCDECNEMILVYEYMEKSTLKSHLYGSDLPSLSWKARLEICIGAAKGLLYLHTGFSKSIIHRDVKSANILLNERLMAKVSDFGLSKIGPELDETHVTTAVKGSFGYLDPEYFRRQMLTDKSDVYSFGVVLLEVVCARPVIDSTLPSEMVNLAEWAIKWLKRGELDQIIDQRIAGTVNPKSLRKYGEMVERCLADNGVDRPTMGDVLWNLEFVLRMEEAGPDISNIYSMNLISELPLRAYLSDDHSDMSIVLPSHS